MSAPRRRQAAPKPIKTDPPRLSKESRSVPKEPKRSERKPDGDYRTTQSFNKEEKLTFAKHQKTYSFSTYLLSWDVALEPREHPTDAMRTSDNRVESRSNTKPHLGSTGLDLGSLGALVPQSKGPGPPRCSPGLLSSRAVYQPQGPFSGILYIFSRLPPKRKSLFFATLGCILWPRDAREGPGDAPGNQNSTHRLPKDIPKRTHK